MEDTFFLSQRLESLFGSPLDQRLDQSVIKSLQTKAWQGSLCQPDCRALVWRLFLGVITDEKGSWVEQMQRQVIDYAAIKTEVLPSIINNKASSIDPLTALQQQQDNNNNDDGSEDWQRYYKDMELSTFIKGDLDRLYMAGIDDDYFQLPSRRSILLSILFVWALQNRHISYRQGMHEIVGPILYCVETELEGWMSSEEMKKDHHPWSGLFSKDTVEAHTFWIYSRIMSELSVLYDPTSTSSGKDSQPAIVLYCTKIQEHYLRELDPILCSHLEDNYVQAQLYGMKWSRLMLGREFPLTHSQSLRLWDYMFATCKSEVTVPAPVNRQLELLLGDTHPFGSSSCSSSNDIISAPDVKALRSRYGPYSPLLGAISDFVLAMLLHIREQLMDADSNLILGYLLRYPPMDDITPILDFADMIRRGVLSSGVFSPPPPLEEKRNNKGYNVSGGVGGGAPPAWLTGNIKGHTSSVINSVGKTFNRVGNSKIFGSSEKPKNSPIEEIEDANSPFKVTPPIDQNDPLMGTSSNIIPSAPSSSSSSSSTPQKIEVESKKRNNSLHLNVFNSSVPEMATVFSSTASSSKLELNKGLDFLLSIPSSFSSSSASSSQQQQSELKATNVSRTISNISPVSSPVIITEEGKENLISIQTEEGNKKMIEAEIDSPQTINEKKRSEYSNDGGDDNDMKNNLVGERLLNISDLLFRFQTSSTSIGSNESEIALRKETATKLRLLVDVLTGLETIDQYDEKIEAMTLVSSNNNNNSISSSTKSKYNISSSGASSSKGQQKSAAAEEALKMLLEK